jgi:cytochrome c oxidase subunit 4
MTRTEELGKSYRVAWTVFGALLILTGITVAVATLHLSFGLAVLLALVIAVSKGALVGGYFMHLIGERPVILWLVLFTFVLLAFLLVLPGLTVGEIGGAVDSWSPVP